MPIRSPPLHILQNSGDNQRRLIRRETNSGLFAWYGDDLGRDDQASLMIYTVRGDVEHGWYASFRRESDWRINKVLGLSVTELVNLIEDGEPE